MKKTLTVTKSEQIILFTLIEEEMDDAKERLIKNRILRKDGKRNQATKWLLPNQKALLKEYKVLVKLSKTLGEFLGWV